MFNDINKVILCGRLTRDAEFKSLSTYEITKLALAVNHKEKTGIEEVCFIEACTFLSIPEDIRMELKKGKQVVIEGRLKYQTWVDRNGGEKITHNIIIDKISLY